MIGERQRRLPRSGCPVSISLEKIGDRWSLLIIRDLMVRGYHTFKQFQESGEGIATNVLANRLKRLRLADVVSVEADPLDRRKLNYRLTEKGIDLAPVVLGVAGLGSETRGNWRSLRRDRAHGAKSRARVGRGATPLGTARPDTVPSTVSTTAGRDTRTQN